MGRATVISHLGDGEYLITPDPDQAYLDEEIQRLTEQLATDTPRLEAAIIAETTARAALDDAQAGIDTIIREAQAANNALLLALQAAMDDLDDATAAEQDQQTAINGMVADQTEQLAVYDQTIEDLEQQLAEASTPEQRAAIQLQIDETETEKTAYELNTNTAITAAYNDLKALKATTKAKLGVVNGAQQTWNDRDQKLAEIRAAMDAAEPLKVAWYKARDDRAALQLQLAAMAQDIKWLEAKRKTPADTSAWCADLTETLTGAVATVEIPGETAGVPVLIRPGYEGRAVWQAQEQHAALVDAVLAAQDGCLSAQSLADLARLNLDAAKQRRDGAASTLALLQADPDTLPALIVSAQALLEAAETTVTTAEASVTSAEQRIVTTRATATAARAALQAARDAAAADGATPDPRMADGRMQPVASSSPWASFWNRAVLPAWQKWRPMYRLGEITELSGDTCTVMLDAAYSSQQAIDLNRETELTGVPIVYMECNGDAFEAGDRVVVEFAYHDQTKPRVVGFESHPKACGTDHGMFITPMSDLSCNGWGYPLTQGEPDWGTPGMSTGSAVDLTGYTGLLDGRGYQVGLLSLTVDGIPSPELVVRHGEPLWPVVGSTSVVSGSGQTEIAGGPVAVTGVLPESATQPDGSIIVPRSIPVWSVKGYQPPWIIPCQRQLAVYETDGLQLQLRDYDNLYESCRFSFYGLASGSPVYRNGKPVAWTSSPVGDGAFLGVGVRQVTVSGQTFRRLLVIGGDLDAYYACYSDPPYNTLTVCGTCTRDSISNLADEQHKMETGQDAGYVAWYFNESGTIASCVAAYVRDAGEFADNDLINRAIDFRVHHIDFTLDGTSATLRSEAEGALGAYYRDDEHSSHSTPVERTIAIGYVGDAEKRLSFWYSGLVTVGSGAGLDEDGPSPQFISSASDSTATGRYKINGRTVTGDIVMYDYHYTGAATSIKDWVGHWKWVTQVGDYTTAETTGYLQLIAVDFRNEAVFFAHKRQANDYTRHREWYIDTFNYTDRSIRLDVLCNADILYAGGGEIFNGETPPEWSV